jgi:hypothetical protein
MRMAWIMGCMITNGGVCCNPSRPRGARRLARLARLHVWHVWYLVRCRGRAVPCLSHGQPRLACHCHFAGLISLPAPSRSATPTLPPFHDTAAPCHDTSNHAPADAPRRRGPSASNLEPRTPPACRNALRLLPSGPRCFWRRLRLYHAQRSHTLPLRFAHGPTVSHPNSSLSWSPTARLPWPPSSPGQVAVAFHADCDGFPCIYMHALIFTLAATAYPRTYTVEHVRPAQPARVHNLALKQALVAPTRSP